MLGFLFQNCKDRSGASIFTIMKYVTKKYSSMEMDKRTKSQYKRAMKKLVEKGAVKQVGGGEEGGGSNYYACVLTIRL